MAGTRYLDPEKAFSRTSRFNGMLLAFLLGFILCGGFYFLSSFNRQVGWAVWLIIVWLLFSFSRELPLGRLVRPAGPYLLWLYFFLTWGIIVSPITDWAYAAKVAITTTILAFCTGILASKPYYLRAFANFAQAGAVVNLVVLIGMAQSTRFATLVMATVAHNLSYVFGSTRYGGMWGNANMVGCVSVAFLILSVLATPWIAWVGRLSCLPLLYYSASRKSAVIFVLLILLYLLIVKRRDFRFWLGLGTLTFSLALTFILSAGLRAKSHLAREDANISRVMDIQEKETAQKGDVTRLSLLHQWLTALTLEPWYGYGMEAMAGTHYDENDPEKIVFKGLFPLGTHNTFLGVWVETGAAGFITFVLMIGYYAWKHLSAKGDPVSRWVMVTFLASNLISLVFMHTILFCFEGKILFTLFFMLPDCAGLRDFQRWRDQLRRSSA